MKGSREIGLRGKGQCDSNIEQGLIPSNQQLFRALNTTRAHVLMRRLAHSGFERSRKVEPAQRSDFRKLGDRKIFFQVGLDVFLHPAQPTSIESSVTESFAIPVGGEASTTVDQPRCQTERQCFRKQPAPGGRCPHFRDDCESDLSN